MLHGQARLNDVGEYAKVAELMSHLCYSFAEGTVTLLEAIAAQLKAFGAETGASSAAASHPVRRLTQTLPQPPSADALLSASAPLVAALQQPLPAQPQQPPPLPHLPQYQYQHHHHQQQHQPFDQFGLGQGLVQPQRAGFGGGGGVNPSVGPAWAPGGGGGRGHAVDTGLGLGLPAGGGSGFPALPPHGFSGGGGPPQTAGAHLDWAHRGPQLAPTAPHSAAPGAPVLDRPPS